MRMNWVIGILAVVAAQGVAEAKGASEPPPELLASIAVAPDPVLDGVRAYANTIKPGSGAMLTDILVRQTMAQLIGATSLDGLDPNAWAYILVTDCRDSATCVSTSDKRTPEGTAIVGKVTDAKKLSTAVGSLNVLIKDHWAVIGAKPLVEKVGPFALATIATQTPTAPSATIYMPQLLARYKTEIADLRKSMSATASMMANAGPMSHMLESYFDGLYSAAADTERLVVTIEASKELGSLDFALVPKPNTPLAKFVALQKPSDYALFDKLPPTTGQMLLGGHLETGPYRDALIDVWARMYGSDATKDLIASITEVMKAATGDVALSLQLTPGKGMAITQVFGLGDVAGADKAIVRLLGLFKTPRTFESMHLSTTITTSPKTSTHDGVTLRGYDVTYDLSKIPADQRKTMEAMLPSTGHHAQIATFDSLGMIAVAGDGDRAIDAARGKGAHFTATKPIADLLSGSRVRKESLAMVLDIGGFLTAFLGKANAGVSPPPGGAPIVMAFGFADRSAHFRFVVPSATVQTLLSLRQP